MRGLHPSTSMRKIQQHIIGDRNYPRTINTTSASANEVAGQLLQGSEGGDIIPIGIAYHLSSKGLADYICLANPTEAFIISFKSKTKMPFSNDFAALLHSGSQTNGKTATSSGKNTCLVGFDMARIAIQVNEATRLDVKGVNLSTLSSPNAEDPLLPSRLAKVLGTVNTRAIDNLRIDRCEKDVVIQSWLAACIGCSCKDLVSAAEKLDTQHISLSERIYLSDLVRESDLLEGLKPTEVESDFSKADLNRKGEFCIMNSRYKSRVRQGDRTQVILTDQSGKEACGRAKQVTGKTATIAVQGTRRLASGVQKVRVVGRPDPINPEKARDELLFLVLAGRKKLSESPFIQWFWLSKRLKHPKQLMRIVNPEFLNRSLMQMLLNDSQRSAVKAMVGQLPIVIVHGPPGTGKTSTIAAASGLWDLCKLPVWIVAHSNVAVKNIAEKFSKKGIEFKLIVSKEFYVEWHEHIYSDVEENLICTDDLPGDKVGMERRISGSTIMLSTLSTLSNPTLHLNGTFQIVPLEFLVIDEASQISVFEFMHVFEKFRTTLKKVCFFGDPKQLPPYGRESIKTMKTIFDLRHLQGKKLDHFLNIQYRMPYPIADFVSRHVYDGKLGSQHEINSPKCLALIDVPRTGEEPVGSSQKNTGEVNTINHLVKQYYGTLNFCVITPYDAQRAEIQKSLEGEKLPSDNVFNVDSFQGNEADFVIVSLVRSSRIGFLQSLNRMNVLLTRCRKGLIVVSSQAFLGADGKGAPTLLGKLVEHWETRYSGQSWIDWRSVAEGSVDLPGVRAPKPKRLSPSIANKIAVVRPHPNKPPLASSSKLSPTTKPTTTSRNCAVAGSKKPTIGSSPKAHWKRKNVAKAAGTSPSSVK